MNNNNGLDSINVPSYLYQTGTVFVRALFIEGLNANTKRYALQHKLLLNTDNIRLCCVHVPYIYIPLFRLVSAQV